MVEIPKSGENENIGLAIGELDGRAFSIPADGLLTGRTCIFGMAGSGKSNLVAVICEQLCESDLPFILIDPEGEYHTLKDKYEIAWAGNDDKADFLLNINECQGLAERMIEKSGRLILDVSESSNDRDIVSIFLTHIFETGSKVMKRPDDEIMPMLVIVDEAEKYVPQLSNDDIKALHLISKRGRKRSIGLLIASQRPASVDKNIVTQCDSQIIGKLIATDIEYVRKNFTSITTDKAKRLPELKPGEFFVMGKITNGSPLIKMSSRITSHPGRTKRLPKRKSKFEVKDLKKVEHPNAHKQNISENSEKEDVGSNTIESIEISSQSLSNGESETRKTEIGSSQKSRNLGIDEIKLDSGIITIRTAELKLYREDALNIAESKVAKSIIGQRKEIIEHCEMVYWPIMSSTIHYSGRGIFGSTHRDITSAWDCINISCIKFDSDNRIKELLPFDEKLVDLTWKQIRILRELSKEDKTKLDIAGNKRSGLGIDEVDDALKVLKAKRLVMSAGKMGRSILFRPTIRIQEPGLNNIETDIPKTGTISISKSNRILPARINEESIRNIMLGLVNHVEITKSDLFYLPTYIISLYSKANNNRRLLRINGMNGQCIDLDESGAKQCGVLDVEGK